MSRLDPDTWNGAQQAAELSRVSNKICWDVLAFCRTIGLGGEFHAKQLHDYVGAHVAPASADRILRDMRSKNYVGYEIVNRRASLYRITKLI